VPSYHAEPFTPSETAVLNRFFTNTDRPVFGLINLPEVVKGALFARYSRSPKSLRRLFLDEFASDPETGAGAAASGAGDDPPVATKRAEDLYRRVFFDFGDDSVAQLGGAHLACEQASNLLTKVLERGRLAAYLEQSTRYVRYDIKLGGRRRYLLPDEIADSALAAPYVSHMDTVFDTYSRMLAKTTDMLEERRLADGADPKRVGSAATRVKACDAVRGMLPVSTLSNVGVYATGQAYEAALARMWAHPVAEVRDYARMMLAELRKIIPSFLTRVDLEDRGVAWSRYLEGARSDLEEQASDLPPPSDPGPSVVLTDWDPDAEAKIAAAALYAVSEAADAELRRVVSEMSPAQRAEVIAALVGDRRDRRHKPGRAMERSAYRFDVKCDIGAFRDLQRHRMMTIEWQRFSTRLGYDVPSAVTGQGLEGEWRSVMDGAGELYESVRAALGADVAQYVVPFAYNVRFVMEMSPRQALHLIELRSRPSGHPAYRSVAYQMHAAIRDKAGHRLIAGSMGFVDHNDVDLGRLEGERRAQAEREAAGT